MQGLPFAQLSQINSYIKPLLGGFERCSAISARSQKDEAPQGHRHPCEIRGTVILERLRSGDKTRKSEEDPTGREGECDEKKDLQKTVLGFYERCFFGGFEFLNCCCLPFPCFFRVFGGKISPRF